jgi:fructose-1,6-bisphosphatase/inositol monophosphatase family enzyme
VDVGRRVLDEFPQTEGAFLAVGDGNVCTNFPYDVAAAALVLTEAGGVITHADGRPLDDHPAVGSGRAEGLAVLAAASAELHAELLDALDRGITHFGSFLGAQGGA